MRQFSPGHPLVFNHIPKAAGTSLRTALQQALQPTVMIRGNDCSLIGGYDEIEAVRPSAGIPIITAPEQLDAEATFVTGHIGPGTTMARYPEGEHITLLRTSQLRVLSQWLHSRSLGEFDLRHWGPPAEAFRVARLPLVEYLNRPMVAPNTDNTITRFLAWPHPKLSQTAFIDESDDDELFDAALARLETFAHVNLVENPEFLSELSSWLGTTLSDTRLNERTYVPRRRRPKLTRELAAGRQLLDYRARIDSRIWDHVAAKVLPGEDPAQIRENAIERSLSRYDAMLNDSKPTGRPSRRAVAAVYEVAVHLDPRWRRARR